MKAQGNQLTKLKVKEIVLTHDIEGEDPWPEDEIVVEPELDGEEGIESEDDGNEAAETTIEWDISKKDEDEDEDQMTLF